MVHGWTKQILLYGLEIEYSKKISQINNNFIKKIINIVRFFGVPSFIRKNIYGDNFLKFNKSEGKINELKLNIATKISGSHFSFLKTKILC